jgi:hypothetical protein
MREKLSVAVVCSQLSKNMLGAWSWVVVFFLLNRVEYIHFHCFLTLGCKGGVGVRGEK